MNAGRAGAPFGKEPVSETLARARGAAGMRRLGEGEREEEGAIWNGERAHTFVPVSAIRESIYIYTSYIDPSLSRECVCCRVAYVGVCVCASDGGEKEGE